MAEIYPITNTERLLLTTDGSEFSEGAVREAISLAKQCSSKLTALSVVEVNAEFEALAPQFIEKQEKEARQNLEKVAAQAKKEGVACEYTVFDGEDAYKVITDEAAKTKASMIIMGRRGRKGLKRLVMGSNTARVIGHASCNVLVVPRAAQVDFKSVVVATDGSPFSVAAASEALGIAKRNKCRLTVVSVVPAELAAPTDIDFASVSREKLADAEMQAAEKNAKAVKDAAQKEGIDVKAFVMTGKPADAIIETAKDAKADLIVVGSHGRTGLDRLLMGSVAERVIVLANCAVLVVKGE
ncbi:MAG: universal stress protein [Nitrospirota bacterium]|nr:universal stress protein [Nitrospirota bacterium]